MVYIFMVHLVVDGPTRPTARVGTINISRINKPALGEAASQELSLYWLVCVQFSVVRLWV